MRKCLTPIGAIDENDLQFVRERYGEPRFGIPAPYTKNKDGSYKQINPHESRFIMPPGYYPYTHSVDGKSITENKFFPNGISTSVMHIKPIYYATPQGTWRPLSEVASYFGNKRGMTLKEGWEQKMDMGYLVWYIKRLEVMKSQYGVAVSYPQTYAGIELTPVQIPVLLNASPLTAYPDPHVETNTVDGVVYHYNGAGLTWAQIIAAAGYDKTDTGAGVEVIKIRCYTSANTFDVLFRSIFLFLTSSIGSTSTITSATLSLHGTDKLDQATTITPDINIYSSAPASNTALAAGDFDSLGTTAFCDTAITYANWDVTAPAYNAFAFNATGIAAIVKDGVSKFGTRNANYDVSGTPPTWTTATEHSLSCNCAETANTTSDPKLVVNYTEAAAAATAGFLFNML